MSRRPKPPAIVSQTLDMTASRWRCVTDYGSCVGCDPSPVAAAPWGNAWDLRLPRVDDNAANKIGYVLCPHTAPITAATIEGTFTLTATTGTQFADAKAPSNGVAPATFRFIIMGGLDGASMDNPDQRYWSNPQCLDMRPGVTITLPVPIAISNWSGVNGQRNESGFKALLAAPQFIGITFGAGGDFGHGIVTVGGYATLRAEGIRLL